MNILERATRASTYSDALRDPGTAVKNIASDPAFGLVAGAMLGMPEFGGFSALQAGAIAGGISALATGSLQKGLMTGLSAYGGAGLGQAFSNAGQAAIEQGALNQSAAESARLGMSQAPFAQAAANAGAQASALDKLSAGFGAATSSSDAALRFAKDNYGKALMAAGPILADQMVATKTPLPTAGSLSGPSYIRPYSMTRKVRQPEPGIGSREQNWFDTTWERGEPYKAANGGIVALAGGGMTSQDAYDFLMGKKSDTGSVVNTVTQAPTYEGHYEFDTATGTSRFVPARTDMTPAIKPVTSTITPSTTTTNAAGITTLVRGAGDVTGQNQAKTNAFFDNMTPEQQADHQAQLAMIDQGLTPMAIKFLKNLKDQFLYKTKDEPLAPVVDMSTGFGGEGEGDGPAGSVSVGGLSPASGDASAPGGVGDSPGGIGIGGDGGGGGDGGIGGIGIGGGGVGSGGDGGGVGGVGSGDGGGVGVGGVGSGGSGGSGGGGGGGCFLTTAAVEHMGQADDGEVLNTFRKFRDGWMRKSKEHRKDIDWYYSNAPKIVDSLDSSPDSGKLYKDLYKNYIMPAYKAIKTGDMKHAYAKYKEMVNHAEDISGINKKELTPRKGFMAAGGMPMATGGISDVAYNLGSYSDGGRLLRGPGDGVSDSIPATIGKDQPARLADGEFVVPARIVSEIGNGSTEAGARKLYAMMDRIQAARKKTIGKDKVAANTKTDKYLPA